MKELFTFKGVLIELTKVVVNRQSIYCQLITVVPKTTLWCVFTVSCFLNMHACTLLPRNQSCYRQITSQEKDGAVNGIGQW